MCQTEIDRNNIERTQIRDWRAEDKLRRNRAFPKRKGQHGEREKIGFLK
jgi:hypothetical protein